MTSPTSTDAPRQEQGAARRAPAGEAPVIAVHAVHKAYRLGPRRVEALRGVDLTIDRPGFYGIMGPSGSGKSTLLHLLAGLDRPDAGTIAVTGQRLDTMPERALTRFRRLGIGVIFQQFNLISTLSALDNVTLPAMLHRVGRAQRNTRGMTLLERLGLAGRAEHRPDALSGGEQQRVAIARALYFDPPVLFADEPTGNLDSQTAGQLWRLLGDLADEREMTVIMVTHESTAASHCRYVYVLRDGRIAGDFSTEGLDLASLATRVQHPAG